MCVFNLEYFNFMSIMFLGPLEIAQLAVESSRYITDGYNE